MDKGKREKARVTFDTFTLFHSRRMGTAITTKIPINIIFSCVQ